VTRKPSAAASRVNGIATCEPPKMNNAPHRILPLEDLGGVALGRAQELPDAGRVPDVRGEHYGPLRLECGDQVTMLLG
jgi:hypothetical protein